MESQDFKKLFSKVEFRAICGEGNRSLYFLTLIVLLTLLALGHVFGGFNNLRTSMNNPYTNWVNVENRYQDSKEDANEALYDTIQEDPTLFDVKSVKPYQKYYFDVFHPDSSNFKRISFRNVSIEDPIRSVIMNPKNIVQEFEVDNPYCSVIISEELLESYSLTALNDNAYLPVLHDSNDSIHFLFPIQNVVKELPNDVGIVVTDRLLTLYEPQLSNTNFYNTSKSNKISFIVEDAKDIQALRSINGIIDVEELNPIKAFDKDYKRVRCFLDSAQWFVEKVKWQRSVGEKLGITPYEEYTCHEVEPNFAADYFSYHFNSLDSIRKFKKFAQEKFGLEVPIYQVESKENFVIVSQIAWTFIALLLLFSTFSVLLFISNILKNHFEKIKQNLGTLMAFGLSEKQIHKMYLGITLRFYFLATFIAIVLTVFYYLIFKAIFKENFLFEIGNPIYLLLLFGITVVLILFFNQLIRKILFRSPGNLIYNR